jgi:hypothetical protein
MILKSKYDLNQKVWRILRDKKKTFVPCETCEGEGKVNLQNSKGILKSMTCPDCYGVKGKTKYLDDIIWRISNKILTIGKISITISNIEKTGGFDNIGCYKEGNDIKKLKYMAYETGINSGGIYDEETLFLSLKEAKERIEELNKGGD